ncbi:MAG: HAD hydrolase family protein [Candidatus Eremiobacteraeota bacterium]|nr:HAD hydrolase family protein [Candidatus Eremiobacteraeota bacterium]
MRYVAFATDFDGTLAEGGAVGARAIEALEALRKSDRALIMVTGRLLEDLQNIFERIDLFDAVVAENGAVLFDPAKNERIVLGPSPPSELLRLLDSVGVPVERGHVIVATREPHEKAVLEAIRDLGLEMQVIFNKGAVMVLPSGINKASGLHAALERLKLSPHNLVGAGDGENDHAFLGLCECSAAPANALDAVKQRVDIVLKQPNGEGVTALATQIRDDDLAEVTLARHRIPFGKATDGSEVYFDPYLRGTLLVAGESGSGKSSAALGLVERFVSQGYQTCIVDPEGDYESFGDAIVLGDSAKGPTVEEIVDVLDQPYRSAIVNLLGVPIADRPAFTDALLPRLFSSRARYGRPHWIVLDEAHHLFPRERRPDGLLPRELYGMLAITTAPSKLAKALLATVSAVVAVGADRETVIEAATGTDVRGKIQANTKVEAVIWRSGASGVETLTEIFPPELERHRHRRKYAEGDLAPTDSFYFQGPDGKLNLRANNLTIFAQIAEGIDDETWLHHLHRGDYARWFANVIGDNDLAEAARVAEDHPEKSRESLLKAIRERYTEPG